MIAALEKAGRPPESLLLPEVGHNYGEPRDRLKRPRPFTWPQAEAARAVRSTHRLP